MAYKLKDRKEKMLYKSSVYELTLQWDRESLRKCFCGMPPFYAHSFRYDVILSVYEM